MTIAFLLAFIKMIGLDLFLRILMTSFCYGQLASDDGVVALFTVTD
jgi:hypothetical protein